MGGRMSGGYRQPDPVDLSVPDPDGGLNLTINDIIGNRQDSQGIVSLYSIMSDEYEGTHHVQYVYPSLATGVLVTTHADAWTLGNSAEIVPANGITGDFHIHHIHLHATSANGQYELRLYEVTTLISVITFSRTDKKDDVEGVELITPHQSANSQIQAKLASENVASADTVRIKIWYHLHS